VLLVILDPLQALPFVTLGPRISLVVDPHDPLRTPVPLQSEAWIMKIIRNMSGAPCGDSPLLSAYPPLWHGRSKGMEPAPLLFQPFTPFSPCRRKDDGALPPSLSSVSSSRVPQTLTFPGRRRSIASIARRLPSVRAPPTFFFFIVLTGDRARLPLRFPSSVALFLSGRLSIVSLFAQPSL